MLIILIIVFVSVIILLWSFELRQTSKARWINRMPGPKCTFFFGNALTFILKTPEDMFDKIVSYYREYQHSPLFRIWVFNRPFVFAIRAESAELILSSTTEINKSDFYKLLQPWLGLGLLTSNGSKWRKHRKLLTPSFHFGILENFLPIFNEQSVILVDQITKAVNKASVEGQTFIDITPFLFLCTLDVICETAMGTNIQAQTQSDTEFVKAIHEMGEISFEKILHPWLQVPWIFNLTTYRGRQKRCLNILHTFSRNVISDRKKSRQTRSTGLSVSENKYDDGIYGLKRRKAFLDTLLDALDDNGFGLTEEEIREEVDTFIFEGLDTTAAALTWALFSLGCHPEIQKNLQEELDQVFGPNMGHVTIQDLKQLKYLEAVFKETLRMFPSVPVFSRRMTKDMEILGFTVPKGTELVISPHAIQRDPKYYPQPNKFDPSRFLETGNLQNPYAYIPFSAGPRNCIGQKFAQMEDKIILAHLFKNFSFSCHQKFNEMKFIDALVMIPAEGLKLTVTIRKQEDTPNPSSCVTED